MVYWVAALIFGIFASNLLAGYVLFSCIRRWLYREEGRIRQEVEYKVRTFVTSPGENTPSPLGAFMDTLACLFAARLLAQIQHVAGGVTKGIVAAEENRRIDEMGSQSPLMALVMGILPKGIRKQLIKNPGMLGALSSLGRGDNHGSTSTEVAIRRHRE